MVPQVPHTKTHQSYYLSSIPIPKKEDSLTFVIGDPSSSILENVQISSVCTKMDALRVLVHEKPVVIFSKSSCCISHSMKQLISSYGANPTVYELDEMSNGQEIEKALKKMGCKPSVPAVFIGERFIGGANEVISLQIQGNLVPLLMEAGAIWIWNST